MAELPRRRPARPASVPAAPIDGPIALRPGGDGVAVDPRPSPLLVFARHPLLVLLAAIGCCVAAYAVSKTQAPRYEATGRLFLVDPNTALELEFARPTYVDPRRNARTRAEIVRSVPVLTRAADRLGVSVGAVRDRVDAVPSRESDIITLTATGDSAEEAARLVRYVQDAYRTVTLTRQLAPYDRAVDDLRSLRLEVERRLSRLNVRVAARPGSTALRVDRDSLRQYLQTLRSREASLRSNAALLGTGVHLFEPPLVPEAPVAPRPLRSGLVAGLFGAVAAVGLLWWREGKDPAVADPDAAAEALGTEILADLRSSLPWRSLVRRARGGREEGYHRLAYRMDALARDGTRVIFITAATPSDLQIAVALRGATGMAAAGRKVAVVDGDRHKRRLSRHLRAAASPGLSDIEREDFDPAAFLVLRRIAGSPPIAVLPLGRRGKRLRALEGTRAYRAALKRLAGNFDVVVANGPALMSLAEANPASLADVQTVVVCGPKTSLGALVDLRGRLDLLGLATAGLVYERSGRLERLARRSLRAVSRGGRRSREVQRSEEKRRVVQRKKTTHSPRPRGKRDR